MVKQSIFNKLSSYLPSAKILDLFCGTGALGIEAYSRGAKEVCFVDKDERSIKLTWANLKSLSILQDVRVIKASYVQALAMLKGQKFDIILLDPPYQSGLYEDALRLIHDYELLNDDGIIACEHDKKVNIDFSLFQVNDEKIYGIKKVTYLEQKNS